MPRKSSPPELPSEREQDVLREIEQATGWPLPEGIEPRGDEPQPPNPEEDL